MQHYILMVQTPVYSVPKLHVRLLVLMCGIRLVLIKNNHYTLFFVSKRDCQCVVVVSVCVCVCVYVCVYVCVCVCVYVSIPLFLSEPSC